MVWSIGDGALMRSGVKKPMWQAARARRGARAHGRSGAAGALCSQRTHRRTARIAPIESGRGTSRASRPVTRAAPDRDGIRPDAAPSNGRATSTPPVQRRGAARTSRGAHATPRHATARRPQAAAAPPPALIVPKPRTPARAVAGRGSAPDRTGPDSATVGVRRNDRAPRPTARRQPSRHRASARPSRRRSGPHRTRRKARHSRVRGYPRAKPPARAARHIAPNSRSGTPSAPRLNLAQTVALAFLRIFRDIIGAQ